MILSSDKAIELAIRSLKKQMQEKPKGGYKVDDDKVKFTEIIATLEELRKDLKSPINNKCKNCDNFAGKFDGTGCCFPQGDKMTCSRSWEDGCTALFVPKKGKNLLEEYENKNKPTADKPKKKAKKK